jgi:hypothetical protein
MWRATSVRPWDLVAAAVMEEAPPVGQMTPTEKAGDESKMRCHVIHHTVTPHSLTLLAISIV